MALLNKEASERTKGKREREQDFSITVSASISYSFMAEGGTICSHFPIFVRGSERARNAFQYEHLIDTFLFSFLLRAMCVTYV